MLGNITLHRVVREMTLHFKCVCANSNNSLLGLSADAAPHFVIRLAARNLGVHFVKVSVLRNWAAFHFLDFHDLVLHFALEPLTQRNKQHSVDGFVSMNLPQHLATRFPAPTESMPSLGPFSNF